MIMYPTALHAAAAVGYGIGSKLQNIVYIITKEVSPRRADARLGSAHARNEQGCKQIAAVNETALPRGTSTMNRV